MGDISFEYPYVLLLIPVFLLCAKFCKARSEAIIFPHLQIFLQNRGKKSIFLSLTKWISIIFAIIALASPVIEDKLEIEKQEGYSIAMVLDASGSMRYGFSNTIGRFVNKFQVSMELAEEFINKRKNDNIGLIAFGNFAYVAAPLTYDKKVLQEIMKSMKIGIAGMNYTVINEALFQSAKLFENSKAKTKIAILLTDGESRGDNIPYDVAIKSVQKYGVKVYTIGIGSERDFNKAHLELIAKDTGGKFFSAQSPQMLKDVYAKINEMEKSEIESEKYIKKNYYYELPLFIAVMSLLLYIFLINKRGIA